MDTEEAVLTLTPTEALRMLAHLYVEESEREKTLHFTDETTVGEFCHFFDFLFDGTRACGANLQKGKAEGANLQKGKAEGANLQKGKAEIRIIRNKRRLLDDMPIKDILNPDRTDELVLSDTMTVAEAEKKLSSCFVDGCFVDICPRNGGYKINKDMLLKDIRHLQAKLHDTSFYF